MIWHLKSLRCVPSLLIAVAVGAVTAVARDIAVIVPSLSQGSPFGALPINAVSPLALLIMIGSLSANAYPALAKTAVRPLSQMLTTFTLLVMTAAIVSYISTAAILFGNFSLDVIRNAVGYLVLFILAARIVGPGLAVVLPSAYVFASAIFGRNGDGGTHIWAWPVREADTVDSVLFAVALSGVALIAYLRPHSRFLAATRSRFGS